MEGPKAVVLEISSDEEEVSGKNRGGGGGEGNFDWLMGMDDNDDDDHYGFGLDSDDVVLVREVVVNSKQSLKSSSVTKVVDDDDDDGDCVVLEEDPDKPVAVDNGDDQVDDDSDDVQVVKEKGQCTSMSYEAMTKLQIEAYGLAIGLTEAVFNCYSLSMVACRDFPHPRHHCAKFPFASTPHESYCEQCHCYVCDSLAPCGDWGNGTSPIDHCHATDKDEFWKNERQNAKKNNKVPPVAPSALSVQPPLLNQSPIFQPVPSYPTQNQVFAQGLIRPCSMSVNSGVTNIARLQGSQPPGFIDPSRLPGYIVPRSKFQDFSVTQQLRNGGYRRLNTIQVGPNALHSHTSFKRTATVTQSLTSPRHGNNSLGPRYVDCLGLVNNVTNSNLGSNPVSSQAQLSVQQSLQSASVNYLPSGPQIFSPQQQQMNAAGSLLPGSYTLSASSNYVNPMSSQPQAPNQPGFGRTSSAYNPSEIHCSSQYVNGVFENSVLSEPQTFFQPYVNGNSMVSQHLNEVNILENPINPVSELSYQVNGPNGGNGFEPAVNCQPVVSLEHHSTPQLDSVFPICLDESQDTFNPGTQTQNTQGPNNESFGFNREHPVPIHEINEPRNVAPHPNGTLYETPLPSALDLSFDDWVFEDQTIPRVIEVNVPPGLNVYSPEPAPVDSWNLF